jgi:hypothetical protein
MERKYSERIMRFLDGLSPEARKEGEALLAKIPDTELPDFEKAQTHSFTYYTPYGELVPHPLSQENLFETIKEKECYMIDCNCPWIETAADIKNADKNFIIGKTIADETPDLKALLLSKAIKTERNNLFLLHVLHLDFGMVICLERFDDGYLPTMDLEILKTISSEKGRATDPQHLAWEASHLAGIDTERKFILDGLRVKRIEDLGPPETLGNIIMRLRQFIDTHLNRCPLNWEDSGCIASVCHTLALAEDYRDVRKKFADTQNRNVLGDTLILQNALFLSIKIYTRDKGLQGMAGYCGVKCVEWVG